MKKALISLLAVAISLVTNGQILKERRVYYLDCSYSMVSPNGIWEKVKSSLIEAINDVSDQTTELIVIPFALDSNGTTKVFSNVATEKGKATLVNQINTIVPNNTSMTYLGIPMNDFMNNRIAPARVTYMFFMTDGQNEQKPDPMPGLLSSWGQKYGDKNIFGFYVVLDQAAKNPTYSKIIAKQPHLWEVKTADVNVNLIRLDNKAVFNAKADKYIDLTVYGNDKGVKYTASFNETVPYKVDKVIRENKKLRVYVSCKAGQTPTASQSCTLKIKANGLGKYDFLVTESITVTCECKPERVLKIKVK